MNEAFGNPKYPTTSNPTQSKPRRKFDKPPVKLACLQCRASRTRCDGKETCSNCLAKDKPCTYTQSKRGGARIRKDKKTVTIEHEYIEIATSSPDSPSHPANVNLDQSDLLELCQPAATNALPLPLFLAQPGAGLFYQDSSSEDADFIFDTIFASNFEPNDSGYGSPEKSRKSTETEEPRSAVLRVYSSDEDILNAYYVYIHPYFPVLPPPEPHQVIDNPKAGVRGTTDGMFTNPTSSDFMPTSPLSLALSATLALIPHPDDPDPSSDESVLLRRSQAQSFALSAVESIETESEILYSTTKPSEALSQGPSLLPRKPFHSKCPIENESIVALLILGTYEYAQRGNISKLRTRAGQALVAAMGSGLHARGNDDGPYAEADRRAWWMTYILVCQGSILSNTSSTIYLYDPRFTTPGPTFLADQKAWRVFLQAQQAIISATQFVLDLENALKSKSTQTSIGERMLELEALIEPLVNEGDQWALEQSPSTSLDWCELKVCQALREMARIKLNSARIKLHRYSAFYDIPVFTKKHCDLASTSDQANQPQSTPPICPCSSKYHNTIQSFLNLDFTQSVQLTPSPPSSYSSTLSTPSAQPSTQQTCSILPFSSHFSAKVCMKSAFNIARSFQNLPYPDNTTNMLNIKNELKTREFERPRMVPVFACCAMQSSYAMVMLCYKTRAMGFGSGEESPAGRLLGQLGEGLTLVLDALRNYSIAYEALGGMKDQIGVAADSVNVMLRDISVPNMDEYQL